MGAFVRGDVIVLPFPFSDLSSSKKRPALVLATLTGENIIVCSITSQHRTGNKYSIKLETSDVKNGSLKQASYIQPDVIFTADSMMVSYKIGELSNEKMLLVTNTLIKIFQAKI